MWPLLLLTDEMGLFYLEPSGPPTSHAFTKRPFCKLESEPIRPSHNFPILRQSVTDKPYPPPLTREESAAFVVALDCRLQRFPVVNLLTKRAGRVTEINLLVVVPIKYSTTHYCFTI